MATGVNNDTPAVTAAKNDMETSVNAIRSTINKLTDEVQNARRGWEGDAFTAANKAADAWSEEAARVNRKLDKISETVGQGDQSYTQMDQDNPAEFNSVVTTL